MVIRLRQPARPLLKSLAAGIILSGITPAIAAPVSQRNHDLLENNVVRGHASPFSHGDMMRRIKTERP